MLSESGSSMKIVVLVKYVPEPSAVWKFAPDHTIDRAAMDGHLSELDEYAVEQAVRLVEGGLDAEITCLCVGPAPAKDALLKALAMGGSKGVLVTDDAIRGSDALGTSLVLARALERIGFDLVLTGMASTDAEMSVLPSMIADRLGINQATFAAALAVRDSTVVISRDSESADLEVTAALPAVVSVTDRIGLAPGDVGLPAAALTVRSITPAPPRPAGTVITDDGTGATQLAGFLAARGLL